MSSNDSNKMVFEDISSSSPRPITNTVKKVSRKTKKLADNYGNSAFKNIDRIIKKAAGDGDKNNYETMVYEGYGPGGVAVIVECLTDNKNRTAGDVRHYFDKFGGNMGTTGCVSFMFTRKGIIILENEGCDEDKLMEDCFEAGADDFNVDGDSIEVSTDPNSVYAISDKLREMGYSVVSAEDSMVPSTYTTLSDEEQIRHMNLLLEALDDNDDVQQVYHNWDMPQEESED